MKLNEELKEKIKRIKQVVGESGGSVTQEDIAKKLGKSRTYLSQLINGKENVSPQFMAFFNETFKGYLFTEEQITKADIAVLQSSINVLLREVAKLKRDAYGDKDAKAYLKELTEEISLDEVGRQMQEER